MDGADAEDYQNSLLDENRGEARPTYDVPIRIDNSRN